MIAAGQPTPPATRTALVAAARTAARLAARQRNAAIELAIAIDDNATLDGARWSSTRGHASARLRKWLAGR